MTKTKDSRTCREFRSQMRLDRRGFVKAGVLGGAGAALSLADVMRANAAPANEKKGNSVIILWMRGGPAHQDMWDTKPEAPIDYRGEFSTIDTNVDGIQISDMLPMCAKMQDKWSILRSLHHDDAGHSAADQICFTGYDNGPNPDQNIHPSCGSVVARQLQHLSPELPAYVMIPRQVPGTDSAYLGVANKPFETLADPASTEVGKFEIPNFALSKGISLDRFGGRRELLSGFDRLRKDVDQSGLMDGMDDFRRQAYEILSTDKARDAFDLDAEPIALRERYGFMPRFDPGASDRCGAPNWAQRMLLARRLVEAGVRLVTVDLRWWDTHVLGFDSLRRGFLPRFDQAYSAIIEDLDDRGLLDSTLVIAWGEFGRTPRVNKNAGRDHYPHVFGAAIAGGGVQGGRVVGSSDSKAAFPKENPKTPQDVLATIYRHVGVDTNAHYLDRSGRPIQALPFGKPIDELF
jgi:hypothetical protein